MRRGSSHLEKTPGLSLGKQDSTPYLKDPVAAIGQSGSEDSCGGNR